MATITFTGDVQRVYYLDEWTSEELEVVIGEPNTFGNKEKIEFIVVANEGNPFESVHFIGDEFTEEISYFTLNHDKTIATYLIDFNYTMDDVIVICDGQGSPIPVDVSGFNNLYKVNDEQLTSLLRETLNILDNDLGEYIIALLELPFMISGDLVGVEKPIHLGNNLMQTKAPQLIDDEITVALGEIYTPTTYNNSYDYINTVCTLYLPFTNKISLESHYVIGETIYIDYIIDLYSGESTLNIASSFTGSIIHSENFVVGRMLPFVSSNTGRRYNSLTDSKELRNGVVTPYIEVIRNVPYEINNSFNLNVSETGILGDFTGYVEVENIKLNCGATNDEMSKINSLLRNGVYIK